MKDKKMWGGRFGSTTAPLAVEYTLSVHFDRELYRHDIMGSQAHARMLAQQGVVSEEEAQSMVQGLNTILAEIESGSFPWRADLEDVHMNIESRLTELIGPAGKKLHTGRSRNDQVALSFRLFVADRLDQWSAALVELILALTKQAENHQSVRLPGFTHLQPAQPVSLSQHLLAYVQMFKRDHERIEDSLKRVKVSPLGAAALAGTTFPLNPEAVASQVKFESVFANSMDAVSDRDFVAEALFVASLIMMHLSRMCEEIILWATPNFGFVRLPDAYSTGSSIMPQKKNPDVAELMRGKTGRVYGDLIGILTVLKGLPLTYNRDLQEDKESFLDGDQTVRTSLQVMAGMISELIFDGLAMERSLKKGFLNATELADYLAAKGIPFREAHHITGRAVAFAETTGKALEDLTLEEFQSFSDRIDHDVYAILDYQAAVARRETCGGTGPKSVGHQIASITGWMEKKSGMVKEVG